MAALRNKSSGIIDWGHDTTERVEKLFDLVICPTGAPTVAGAIGSCYVKGASHRLAMGRMEEVIVGAGAMDAKLQYLR